MQGNIQHKPQLHFSQKQTRLTTKGTHHDQQRLIQKDLRGQNKYHSLSLPPAEVSLTDKLNPVADGTPKYHEATKLSKQKRLRTVNLNSDGMKRTTLLKTSQRYAPTTTLRTYGVKGKKKQQQQTIHDHVRQIQYGNKLLSQCLGMN